LNDIWLCARMGVAMDKRSASARQRGSQAMISGRNGGANLGKQPAKDGFDFGSGGGEPSNYEKKNSFFVQNIVKASGGRTKIFLKTLAVAKHCVAKNTENRLESGAR
jgi:hypothetical protein